MENAKFQQSTVTINELRIELDRLIDLRDKILNLEERIRNGEKELMRMEQFEYPWADVVQGSRSDLTIGPIAVRGIPVTEIDRKRNILRTQRSHLTALEEQLDEQTHVAESLIARMPFTLHREIIAERYIRQRKWKDVASEMNRKFPKKKKRFTEESCKKMMQRFWGGVGNEK